MESVSKNRTEESISMPVFPRNVIVDTLSRLPVKSLLRFKCVCKPWDSLISNPQFVKMHLNRAMKDINNRQKCLISTEPLQSTDLGADDDDEDAAVTLCYPLRMEPERDLQLVGSANGLVCLVFDRYHIILWNPCTGEAKELAKSTFVPKFRGYSYEPCFTFGLGYDSSIDDYKVVILENSSTYDDHDHVYVVETEGEVFTLKTNSWRRIQDIPPSACMCNGGGIFSNGSLHWLLDRGNGHEKFNSIISFDLATEKFQEVVPLPDHDVKMGLIKDVRVLRGCLSALYCYDNNFEIWVMKEYRVKESWTKLATISCEKAPPYKGLPNYQNWLYPLWFSKNDEVLMDVGGLELVMYNLKEETFRKLPLYGQNWYILETVMYVESLVSPNCNNGTDKQCQGQRKRRKKMKNWGDRLERRTKTSSVEELPCPSSLEKVNTVWPLCFLKMPQLLS